MDTNSRSNQGSWRVRPQTPPPAGSGDAPGAPPLATAPSKAEPFHTTRLPKQQSVPLQTAAQAAPPLTPVRPATQAEPLAETPPKRPMGLPKFKSKAKPVREPKPAPQPRQKSGDTNVTINISMPKLPKPDVAAWPWKKIRKYAIIAVILVVISIVLRLVIVYAMEQHRINVEKNRLDTVQPTKSAPSFAPLTPKGKTASVNKKAGFDGVRDSYSYNDVLKGGEIIVSQQPIKGSMTAADVAAKAAKSLNATTPLSLSNGTGYMADAKSGGQTVVVGRGNVLLFVQSAIVHSAADWQSYLDNLVTT